MRGPRDPSMRGYLQLRIPGFILSDTVQKWRCAMWTMGTPGALTFLATVAVMVAVALLLLGLMPVRIAQEGR
jgi:hypothetical protein